MQPRIEKSKEKKLVGKRSKISFANDKIRELWSSFMPRTRHAEPTNFLNITTLPAWASPTVRLHKERPAYELNQFLSNPGFSTCTS